MVVFMTVHFLQSFFKPHIRPSPKRLIVSHRFYWTRGDDEFPFPIFSGKGPGDR